ncbi:peptidylprolyl isomerase [Aquimonas sp.]|uniref:peptidylprolyl isomerase n=1 Tax=Aquimonas sp. TaxID=1872588 RepID=UPI0037C13778
MNLKPMLALLLSLSLAAPLFAHAQSAPRVLLDTDHGPILIELDAVNKPVTAANFLSYVDDGTYNDTLFQRVVRDFVVQGGARKANFTQVNRRAGIASERTRPGLKNVRGTIAMALSASGGAYNYNSATSDFFFNSRDNASLDPDFTAFGRIVFGMGTLEALNNTPLFSGTEEPVRYPLIRRAVRTTGFPILALHSGGWYDPTKDKRGISVEISNAAPGGGDPLLVIYWYDYFEGKQVWMSGVAPFQWGASQVTVPMQITTGGQFGAAFNPQNVVSTPAWGTLTVRFTSCDRALFTYQSAFGNGELTLQRITIPTNSTCTGG